MNAEMDCETLIVGAGPAGLATAYHLKKLGVNFFLADEAAGAGGAFMRAYLGMRLISPRRLTQLPGLPFRDSEPYPLASRFGAYLENYFQHFRFKGRFGVRVVALRREADGTFAAELNAPNPPVRCRFVVAATGLFANPRFPECAPDGGPNAIHARDYAVPEPYMGRRVLVVGGGNSGAEIALELSGATRVHLSVRRPLSLTSRTRWGIDRHYWAHPLQFVPLKAAPFLAKKSEAPTFDNGIGRALDSGNPILKPALAEWNGATARFADGSREEYDAAIFATGYRPALGWTRPAAGAVPQIPFVSGAPLDGLGPGIFPIGLPGQRTVASGFVRGMPSDARILARRLLRSLKESA